MSRAWRKGSSRAWREVRTYVLARDRHECRVLVDDAGEPHPRGQECRAHAETVDHIVALADGGAMLDPANLRAACTRHNAQLGGAMAHRFRGVHRTWKW